MNSLWLFLKGLAAGLAIAVPVGPVNVLVASRALVRGRRSAIVSGAGAAMADTLYGSVAGFSITFIIQFLKREEFWIRVVGGALLVGIGIAYFFKAPHRMGGRECDPSAHSELVSTLLLTLTNPTTVLSFLAVLAGLGLGGEDPGWSTLLVVGGIFCGSMFWWIFLTESVYRLRNRFNDASIRWMNRIGGVAIGLFGAVTFVLGIAEGR